MQSKDRTFQVVAIVGLIIGVAGLTLGFAAFTQSLTISSSAEVELADKELDVVFSSTNTAVTNGNGTTVTGVTSGTAGAVASAATINETTVSNIHVKFTAANQTATYTFYVHNGSDFTAHLTGINFATVAGTSPASSQKCTAKATNGATSGLSDACGDITLTVDFDGFSATTTPASISPAKSITAGQYKTVTVTVTYSGTHPVDGDFDVEFGDITLNFSSVAP